MNNNKKKMPCLRLSLTETSAIGSLSLILSKAAKAMITVDQQRRRFLKFAAD